MTFPAALLHTVANGSNSFTQQSAHCELQSAFASGFKEEGHRLDEIAELVEDWDDRGSKAPSAETIIFARGVLDVLRSLIIDDGAKWVSPNITASEEGEIVFEWWNDTLKLTLYCTNDGLQYIQVWGANIKQEMDDGAITKPAEFRRLWNWLKAR